MAESQAGPAAYLARMTAGTTHEFRNILAIVSESAGLIEDLVRASATGGPLNRDALLRAVERIGKQVARGADLVTALNGLAHALDHDRETLDLAEQAHRAAVLCRRWTAQGDHRVTILPPAAPVRVDSNRLRLAQALSAALECAVRLAPAGTEVTLSPVLEQARPAVRLQAAAPVYAGAALETGDWQRLLEAVTAAGGGVEVGGGGSDFVVLFPVTGEGVR